MKIVEFKSNSINGRNETVLISTENYQEALNKWSSITDYEDVYVDEDGYLTKWFDDGTKVVFLTNDKANTDLISRSIVLEYLKQKGMADLGDLNTLSDKYPLDISGHCINTQTAYIEVKGRGKVNGYINRPPVYSTTYTNCYIDEHKVMNAIATENDTTKSFIAVLYDDGYMFIWKACNYSKKDFKYKSDRTIFDGGEKKKMPVYYYEFKDSSRVVKYSVDRGKYEFTDLTYEDWKNATKQ